MVASRRSAIGIACPSSRIDSQLSTYPSNQVSGWSSVGEQSGSRKAKQAQLHTEPNAICVAATSANCCQIDVSEGEQPDELCIGSGQGEETVTLRRGQDRPAGQVNPS